MEEFSAKNNTNGLEQNRRTTKRVKFLKKVKFGIGQAAFPGSSYNISPNGILVHSFKAFLPSSYLNIRIFTDSDTFDLAAQVKWVKKTNDNTGSFMGLQFMGKNVEIGKLYQREIELSPSGDGAH